MPVQEVPRSFIPTIHRIAALKNSRYNPSQILDRVYRAHDLAHGKTAKSPKTTTTTQRTRR